MMMSLIFEGRLHTFAPVTYLDRMDLTVIRPLAYLNEADVIGFVNKNNVPVVKSACPADGYTKRQYVKDLLKQLNQDNPGVKNRMFTAIHDGNLQGWQPITEDPLIDQSDMNLDE
jgi:tRNA(Ile)-lysidine synthase TilS/MesJ